MIDTAIDIMYVICFYTGCRIIIRRNCYDNNTKRALFKATLAAVVCLALIGYLRIV